jgi:polyhydroxybutyrate depolymerase
MTRQTITVGGRRRTYLHVAPRTPNASAPLLLALHGTTQTGSTMRRFSGRTLDRLAERLGADLVYLDGYRRAWNDARITKISAAQKKNVDDVGFVTAIVERFQRPTIAIGYSNGGQLLHRVLRETHGLLAGAVLIAASLPVEEDFALVGQAPDAIPTLLMHGTADPVVPYDGGDTRLLGLFTRGAVRSARETAEAYAAGASMSAASAVGARAVKAYAAGVEASRSAASAASASGAAAVASGVRSAAFAAGAAAGISAPGLAELEPASATATAPQPATEPQAPNFAAAASRVEPASARVEPASARAESASARITLSEVGLAAATVVQDGGVERMEWVAGRGTDRRAVRLVTQLGTGHVIPNLVTSPSPRFIGPSHHDLDTGSEIESFFSLDDASAAPSTRAGAAAE